MLSAEEQETLETYNKIAGGWTATLRDDFWLNEYNKFFGFLPKGKILDIGCGSGRDSLWFTDSGYDYVGFDASEEMIKLAKKKNPKAAFFIKSFYEPDFPPQSFDGFWAACSLIHVPKNKIGIVLERTKAILKPGAIGFVAIKEGGGEKKLEWQQSGQKRYFVYYSQDEFAQVLQTAGFEILETSKRAPKDQGQESTFLVYFVKAA